MCGGSITAFTSRHPPLHISSTTQHGNRSYRKHTLKPHVVVVLCPPQSPPAWEIHMLSEHHDQRCRVGGILRKDGPRVEAATGKPTLEKPGAASQMNWAQHLQADANFTQPARVSKKTKQQSSSFHDENEVHNPALLYPLLFLPPPSLYIKSSGKEEISE